MRLTGKNRFNASFILLLFKLIVPECDANPTTNITPTLGKGNLGSKITGDRINFKITGGHRPNQGSNLFHSFTSFNLGGGDIANFLNDSGLKTNNIFSRVTGGNPSKIFGTIKTTGFPNAHLYLINPNGLLFGPSASLDIEGSIHLSTADYLKFKDGNRFNARPSDREIPLSIEPIEAFGFLSKTPKPIHFHGSQLIACTLFEGECNRHDTGKTMSILAGNIDISDASSLLVPGGQLNLVSIASKGEATESHKGLDTGSLLRLGTITLSNNARIGDSSEFGGGGKIFIRGGQFVIENANITSLSSNKLRGKIDIDITDDLLIRGDNSNIITDTFDSTTASSIDIKAKNLWITNTSRIIARTLGSGNSGTITIRTGKLFLSGNSQILASNESTAGDAGLAGTIDIHADQIQLQSESNISSQSNSSNRRANSGNILIKVNDSFRLFDNSQVTVETQAANAGDINIQVGDLFQIDQGSSVTTSAAGGTGNGGNININSQLILLDNKSQIVAKALTGFGGDIQLKTDYLFNSPDSTISAASEAPGLDGTITINAPENNLLNSITTLPTTLFDATRFLSTPCAFRKESDVIHFTVRKYEVLPDSPYALRVPPPNNAATASDNKADATHKTRYLESLTGCGDD